MHAAPYLLELQWILTCAVFLLVAFQDVVELPAASSVAWEWHHVWDDAANFLQPHQQPGIANAYPRCWSARDLAVWEPLSCLFKAAQTTAFGLEHGPARFLQASLLLHGLNVVLVARLAYGVEDLLRGGGAAISRPHRVASSYLTALVLIGVHPLRAECVCWASAQSYLLAAAFAMVAFGGIVRQLATAPNTAITPTRTPCNSGGMATAAKGFVVLLCLAAAVLCKSAAISVPGVVLLVDGLRCFRPAARARVVLLSAAARACVLLALVYTAIRCAVWASRLSERQVSVDLSVAERFVRCACAVVNFHVAKLVYPRRLANFYPLPLAGFGPTASNTCAVVAAVGTSLLALLGLLRWTRGSSPKPKAERTMETLHELLTSPSLAWCVFGVLLAPTLNLFPSVGHGYPALAADRYSYMASIAFVPACAARLGRALAVPPTTPRRRFLGVSLRISLALLVSALAISTRAACVRWHNDVALWGWAVATNEEANPIAYANLRTALAAADPTTSSSSPSAAAAVALTGPSSSTSTELLREAWLVTHHAVQYNPKYTKDPGKVAAAYAKSAATLVKNGLNAEAMDAYGRAGAINHTDARLWVSVANGLASLGNLPGAAAAYAQTARLLPDNPAVRCNYAELLVAIATEGGAANIYGDEGPSATDPLRELSSCADLMRLKFGSNDGRAKAAALRVEEIRSRLLLGAAPRGAAEEAAA